MDDIENMRLREFDEDQLIDLVKAFHDEFVNKYSYIYDDAFWKKCRRRAFWLGCRYFYVFDQDRINSIVKEMIEDERKKYYGRKTKSKFRYS